MRNELEPRVDKAGHTLRRELREGAGQGLQVRELRLRHRVRRRQLADEAQEGAEVGARRKVAAPLVKVALQHCAHKRGIRAGFFGVAVYPSI